MSISNVTILSVVEIRNNTGCFGTYESIEIVEKLANLNSISVSMSKAGNIKSHVVTENHVSSKVMTLEMLSEQRLVILQTRAVEKSLIPSLDNKFPYGIHKYADMLMTNILKILTSFFLS